MVVEKEPTQMLWQSTNTDRSLGVLSSVPSGKSVQFLESGHNYYIFLPLSSKVCLYANIKIDSDPQLSLTYTADGASPGEPGGHLKTGKKVLGYFWKTLLKHSCRANCTLKITN